MKGENMRIEVNGVVLKGIGEDEFSFKSDPTPYTTIEVATHKDLQRLEHLLGLGAEYEEILENGSDKQLYRQYQQDVKRTFDVKGVARNDQLINVTFGLTGEANEVVDLVKKHLYQGHDLDKEKITEELGDVTWYLANMCNVLGIDMVDVLMANIKKLEKRYPNGFNHKDSVERVDVSE